MGMNDFCPSVLGCGIIEGSGKHRKNLTAKAHLNNRTADNQHYIDQQLLCGRKANSHLAQNCIDEKGKDKEDKDATGGHMVNRKVGAMDNVN